MRSRDGWAAPPPRDASAYPRRWTHFSIATASSTRITSRPRNTTRASRPCCCPTGHRPPPRRKCARRRRFVAGTLKPTAMPLSEFFDVPQEREWRVEHACKALAERASADELPGRNVGHEFKRAPPDRRDRAAAQQLNGTHGAATEPERLSGFERRQQPRGVSRQHQLTRSRRADHQQAQSARCEATAPYLNKTPSDRLQ